MAEPPNVLDVLQAASERGRRTKHSPLYLWLLDNAAALEAHFAREGVSWGAFAQALADAGLTDAEGKAPTVKRAQKTWYAVRRRLEARAKAPAAVRERLPQSPAGAAEQRGADQIEEMMRKLGKAAVPLPPPIKP